MAPERIVSESFNLNDLSDDELITEIISELFEDNVEDALLVEIEQERESVNGIDMGAPGCKGLLTLWQLAATEQLRREAKGHWTTEKTMFVDSAMPLPERVESFNMANPMYTWLADTVYQATDEQFIDYFLNEELIKDQVLVDHTIFESAGDDLIGLGQHSRLNRLIQIQRQNDGVVADKKFLLSPIFGIMCEKGILRTSGTQVAAAASKARYESHMLVDAYKVRLFSPCSKAQETQDGTNPAIGKALQLFELQEPLADGWSCYDQVGRTVRFATRMHSFLPHDKKGNIAKMAFLPSNLGGLGIYPKFGLYDEVLRCLSKDHAFLIDLVVNQGVRDPNIFRILSSFSRDKSARGVEIRESIIDQLFRNLEDEADNQPRTVGAWMDIYDIPAPTFGGYRAKRAKLQSQGFISLRDLKQSYSRAWAQAESLLGNLTTKPWDIQEWPKRIKAFERSVSRYASILRVPGVCDTYEPDLVELASKLNGMNPKELRSLSFQDEVFWHPDTGVQQKDGSRFYPIKAIKDALIRLELPAISDRRWFPQSTEREDEFSSEEDLL